MNSSPSSLQHVFGLHNLLKDKKIILAFEGGFTQEVTKHILSLTEYQLDNLKEELTIKKKVFNVLVECLQNIVKHADEADKPENWMQDGIVVIGRDSEGYFLVSGNFINNTVIPLLEQKIIEVNALDKDGLKELYKQKLANTSLSDKGGAGLGLIDIARKSGQKLEYFFHKIDEKVSFYTLTTRVVRKEMVA